MLKSLDMQGFKSFADKVTLHFPQGITAVVGPNGSGKSNVVDALRWVLGEQSSKNIRIAGATDVIFNGTPQRAQSAFASVSLAFDNARKMFPVDFSEVATSRKVYRDGASEYTVNKKQVRLKDITQMLAGAKLGVKGMSIINQGAGDVFLRANPVERREMIEEMVGLKEFRLKKEDAERRMQETQENIAKVQGILLELEPNIRSLRRQVQKWESRAEKERELQDLAVSYFAHKIWDLNHTFESLASGASGADALQRDIDALRADILSLQGDLAKAEYEDPSQKIERARLQQEIADHERQRSETTRLLGNLEGQVQVYRNLTKTEAAFDVQGAHAQFNEIRAQLRMLLDIDTLAGLREKVNAILSDLDAFLSRGVEQKPEENEQLRSCEQQKRQAQETLQKCVAQIEQLNADIRALDAHASDQSQQLRTVVKTLEEKRALMRQKESAWEEMRFASERKNLYEDDLKLKLQEAGFSWEVFCKEHRGDIAHASETPILVADVEMRMIRLRRDLSLIGEIDKEVVASYEETAKRFEFLTHEKADLESALEDLQALNASLEEKITAGFEQSLAAIDHEFDRCFQLIFEGGKASVRTIRVGIGESDEPGDNAVDAVAPESAASRGQGELGIDFSVHLPRKKIKSLEMLSGGERSLTAIALLFAIITSAKPPLLVLDEIDAALDEANSRKFARLLREISGNDVQFIIVTHNRSVMEAADILYGVTMQDGVSKVFSLKFAQAEELAEQDRKADAAAAQV